ncbi:unnamed protein product, partial [Pleuronectes platessa]
APAERPRSSDLKPNLKPAHSPGGSPLIGYLRCAPLRLQTLFLFCLRGSSLSPRCSVLAVDETSLFNIFRSTSPCEGGSCRAAASIKPPAARSLRTDTRSPVQTESSFERICLARGREAACR